MTICCPILSLNKSFQDPQIFSSKSKMIRKILFFGVFDHTNQSVQSQKKARNLKC